MPFLLSSLFLKGIRASIVLLCILCLSWASVATVTPQPYSFASPLEKVYAGYCQNNATPWREGLKQLSIRCEANPANARCLFEWVLGEYGFIGFAITAEQTLGMDARIDRALANAALLEKNPEYASSAAAMAGGLIAMKIMIKPIRAIGLGGKSEKALKRGIAIDAQNPVAWVEMGNLKFHAPGIFGGSTEEAIECFEKAISLFDQKPALRNQNWQYLHAFAWLGKAYEETGQKAQAKAVYERALAYEPAFTWVKNELLPGVK